jgi:hypothetical protein
MLVKCLVKCARRLELFCDLILNTVVLQVTLLAWIVSFRYDSRSPNPIQRANSFSITMRSWPS